MRADVKLTSGYCSGDVLIVAEFAGDETGAIVISAADLWLCAYI